MKNCVDICIHVHTNYASPMPRRTYFPTSSSGSYLRTAGVRYRRIQSPESRASKSPARFLPLERSSLMYSFSVSVYSVLCVMCLCVSSVAYLVYCTLLQNWVCMRSSIRGRIIDICMVQHTNDK